MPKNITEEIFNRLLEAFSSDQAEAGLAYTKLRDSLVRFFQLKGDLAPDEAADATLDRVAIKLSEDSSIDDLAKYSFGVARLIFLERLRIAQKEKVTAEEYYQRKNLSSNEAEADTFLPLRECFESLSPAEKEILKSYFADLPYQKLTKRRQELAKQNNLSVNHFRLKIFRLRQRLEKCVRQKLEKNS